MSTVVRDPLAHVDVHGDFGNSVYIECRKCFATLATDLQTVRQYVDVVNDHFSKAHKA